MQEANEPRMRPELYRSVWFWLGGFVLVFLLWVWVDSYRTATFLFRTVSIEETGADYRTVYEDGARLESGRFRLYMTSASKLAPGASVVRKEPNFMRFPPEAGDETTAFRAARHHYTETKAATVYLTSVEVPMWGVVGLYVMICGGVVVRRRRRIRRVLLDGESTRMEGVNG